MTTSGGCVISAGGGENALYLQASSVYLLSNFRTTGDIIADGNINNVSIALESTSFPNIDTDNRRVIRTNTALVLSANSGSNALYLDASTTHIIYAFRAWGTLTAEGSATLKRDLTVNGDTTLKGDLTISGSATINNVSIALENIGFSGAGIAKDNRRVIRTATALVISANSGTNAMYLDASTVHAIHDLQVYENFAVNGNATISGTINGLSIATENFSATGVSAGSRKVIRAKESMVITANDGGYALYLQGSSVVSISNFSTLGTLTADGNTTLKGTLAVTGNTTLSGNINGVTITSESIGFSAANISAATRRVIRTTNGTVITANNGANAMIIQGSTIYLVGNARISGTAAFTSGTTITSDARLKNSIEPLTDDSRYAKFYDLLRPVTHKYNDGQSGRTHMGFIAQEVKEALEAAGFTTEEIAAYVELESEREGLNGYECAIRYNEFIPLNTAMIQKCLAKIFELQQKVNSLEGV